MLDGERYALEAGDTITFDADLPHYFENPGRGQTTFVAVVTSGLRSV
jgi:quercetin dioxygenase-like cupin family protein